MSVLNVSFRRKTPPLKVDAPFFFHVITLFVGPQGTRGRGGKVLDPF